MTNKTFLAVVAATIAMTACLKVQKKSEVAAKQVQTQAKPPQPQRKQVNTRELRLDDVLIEFVGQPQPDVYNMMFSWPETRDRIRVSVNGQVAFAVNTSERPSEGVSNLQGGCKVSVLIEILDQQYHVITSGVRDFDVPKDYIFPNQVKLTGNMKIQNERVFMNNSVITTENFNLEIQTKKLIVLDKSSALAKSSIQNFIPGAKAKHGDDGRSGGLIRIDAEYAEGDLVFTMNSEAGGDAFKGYFYKYPLAGTAAIMEDAICPLGTNGFAAGRNGDLNLKVKDISNFRHYVQETLSEGGQIAPTLQRGEISNYPTMPSFHVKVMDCPKRPSPGGGAQPGKICLTFSGQVPQQGCE